MALGRACLTCGRRIRDGDRCPDCLTRYRLRTSCVECGRAATVGPYCDDHQPEPRERDRAAYRAGYRDPAYHRERQATLNRAGGACERCGISAPLQVDHIVPLRDGGSNRRENLQALCKMCHDSKTRADRRRRA